jgi:hypothetical protein
MRRRSLATLGRVDVPGAVQMRFAKRTSLVAAFVTVAIMVVPAHGASAEVPFRGTLVGTAGTLGHITLSRGGKPVRSLRAGRYKIVVTDTAPRSGFVLARPNGTEIVVTGLAFVGTRSTTLVLTPGRWSYHGTLGALHDFDVVR